MIRHILLLHILLVIWLSVGVNKLLRTWAAIYKLGGLVLMWLFKNIVLQIIGYVILFMMLS